MILIHLDFMYHVTNPCPSPSLRRFIGMKFKAVTFIDSSFLNCYFEDVSSVGSFFKNCTFVDSFFYNTGESPPPEVTRIQSVSFLPPQKIPLHHRCFT